MHVLKGTVAASTAVVVAGALEPPRDAGVRSLAYNTEIFDALGLKAPTAWDELRADAEAIHAAYPDKVAVAVPGDAEFTVYPWVWGAGGEVATLDGDTWTSRRRRAGAGLPVPSGVRPGVVAARCTA